MSNYLKNVDGENILKKCDINLSEFLHPEAFINALRQKTAREKKIPIDELEIVSDFKETPGEISAKIVGLFLQGADFDGEKLVDIQGNQILLYFLIIEPILFFYADLLFLYKNT